MSLGAVKAFCLEGNCAGGGPAGFFYYGDVYIRGFVFYVGVYLYIVDVYGVFCLQLDISNYPVPVALGIVGDTVCIFADVNLDRVIDTKSDVVFAGLKDSKLKPIGSTETVFGADIFAVHPCLCFPVTSLQEKCYVLILEVLRYIDLFFVPGFAYIML